MKTLEELKQEMDSAWDAYAAAGAAFDAAARAAWAAFDAAAGAYEDAWGAWDAARSAYNKKLKEVESEDT